MSVNDKVKGVYHFKINTNRFQINYKISNIKEGYYPHLGVTAREGIILLYKHPQKDLWVSIDAYHNSNIAYVNMSHMLPNNVYYEVLLYTPLLSNLEELTIETNNQQHIEYIDDKNNKEIIVCGGSTSFGMGCTAVSLMFSNILGRKLGANITNISYDTDDYIEKINESSLIDTKNRYDVGIIELNCVEKDKIILYKQVIEKLKSCCDILIGWYFHEEIKDIIGEFLKEDLDNNIILKDISYIFNEDNKDMCSYNDKCINDSGNILIFKDLFSTICGVTKWNI